MGKYGCWGVDLNEVGEGKWVGDGLLGGNIGVGGGEGEGLEAGDYLC